MPAKNAERFNLSDVIRTAGYRAFESISGVYNVQANVQSQTAGITHYYDADTLRFFHCKVVSACTYDDGVTLGTVCVQAKNYDNTQRGYTFVIHAFDGHCLTDAGDKRQWFADKQAARKAMHAFADTLDAREVLRDALARIESRAKSQLVQIKEARNRARIAAIRQSVVA